MVLELSNNNKRGDFRICYILARIVDGATDGFIQPDHNNADCWKCATIYGNYAIHTTLAEALELFLDPVVARTKNFPPDAIQVVRWWQKPRQPGPPRFDDLVMPLLNKRELARIAEYTPTKHDDHFQESIEAEFEVQ
jgi:hypothetical protein